MRLERDRDLSVLSKGKAGSGKTAKGKAAAEVGQCCDPTPAKGIFLSSYTSISFLHQFAHSARPSLPLCVHVCMCRGQFIFAIQYIIYVHSYHTCNSSVVPIFHIFFFAFPPFFLALRCKSRQVSPFREYMISKNNLPSLLYCSKLDLRQLEDAVSFWKLLFQSAHFLSRIF